MKKHLTPRFRYLRNVELFNAFFLPPTFSWLWSFEESVNWGLRFGCMSLVSFLLLQGSAYWHLKLIALQRRSALPAQAIRVYKMLRVVNVGALVAGFAGVSFTVAAPTVDVRDAAWAYGLLVFAKLEYVNYYVVQLSHDNPRDISYLLRHRRLRKAALADELERPRG